MRLSLLQTGKCRPQTVVLDAWKEIAQHMVCVVLLSALTHDMKDPLRNGHWKDLLKNVKLA